MKPVYLFMLLAIGAAASDGPAVGQDGAGATTQPATRPVQPEPSPEALKLLRQLDDPDYAQREQAEQALYSLLLSDPALEEWLRTAAKRDPSPEVRARAASVLGKLAEHRLLGATLVSIHVKEIHPRQLIRELSEQSGVRFDYWPQDPWDQGGSSEGKVTLDLDKAPFWEAMRRVSEITGLKPVEHQSTSAGAIVLSPHGEPLGVAPMVHHGAFAVEFRRLHRSQSSRLELGVGPDGVVAGNANSDSSLMVEMRLLVEPKMRLSGNVSQPILEEVVDENGQDLTVNVDPRFRGGVGWTNASSAWSVQSTVNLDAKSAAKSRMIARMRGRIEVEIATELDTLEVKLDELVDLRRLPEGEKRELSRRYTVGPYRVEITSIQRSGDETLQFEMSLTWDQLPDAEQQAGWVRAQALLNSLRLEDAAGRQWTSQNSGNSWDGTVVKASRMFHRSGGEAGTPVRLVLEVPTRVMNVNIPFEFTDIPLPQWE